MMGPAGFLLAIMGCGESEAQCQQVALAPARYESQAVCLAASDAQLARHTDLAFPVVVAECRAAGVQTAALRADEVQRPEGGQLRGRVQTASAARR
jgi:hypothetical protein